MKVLCVIVALTGCDRVFDIEAVALPPDAAPFDTFDPAQSCPTGYSTVLQGTSRYRIIIAADAVIDQFNDCADDTAGMFTHLAVLDTPSELTAVQTHLSNSGMYTWWVGAVQQRDQLDSADGWRWATGEALDASVWDVSGSAGGEPNDGDGTENNQENVARVVADRAGLLDGIASNEFGAICECDGRPIADDVRAAFLANQ